MSDTKFACVDNGHYAYPASHLLLPSIIFFIYGEGKWDSFFFAFGLACLWELLEYATFEIFDSYLTFPDSSESLEVVCDIVLLDIGNAILGCILSWVTLYATNTTVAQSVTLYDIILVILMFALYSLASSTGWYCNEWFNCTQGEMTSFPYGHIVCVLAMAVVCFYVIRLRSSLKLASYVFFNVCVVTLLSSFLFLSSAILTYIACLGLLVMYGGIIVYNRLTRSYRKLRQIP